MALYCCCAFLQPVVVSSESISSDANANANTLSVTFFIDKLALLILF
jgi:hypothetical protein